MILLRKFLKEKVDYESIIATAKVNKGKFNWTDYTTGNKHQIISSNPPLPLPTPTLTPLPTLLPILPLSVCTLIPLYLTFLKSPKINTLVFDD